MEDTNMVTNIGLVASVALALSSPIMVQAAEQAQKPLLGQKVQAADTQGARVTGQLTHIEGWHYTIKDSNGQEVSFGVTSETNDPHKVKEGDHIVAMIREDRIALSIRNVKKKN
jgi:hypothetical protein